MMNESLDAIEHLSKTEADLLTDWEAQFLEPIEHQLGVIGGNLGRQKN